MQNYKWLCLLAMMVSFSVRAQFRCGFDPVIKKTELRNPEYRRDLNMLETSLQHKIAAQRKAKASMRGSAVATYYIPVVVHVLHTGGAEGTAYNPSSNQITDAINYLNAVYSGTWTGSGGPMTGAGDLQIRFVLATKDPNNNPTNGINRVNASGIANYAAQGVNAAGSSGASELEVKNLTRWDPFKYYNIWLVNKIDGCDGISGCSSFIAGYAYFPFYDVTATIRDLDGTLMLASQMVAGQKTLPHELGHAFNLYHPFEDETDVAGANGCPPADAALGDMCADTNPITSPVDDAEPYPFACRVGIGCYGLPYNDNTEKNFMNYTSCHNLFTYNQKERMVASVTSTMRASLASSWANNQGFYPTAFTAPVAPAVTPTVPGGATGFSGVLSVSLNGRTVYSLNASQDGGYLNNASKWYQLFQLQKNTTYVMTVETPSGNRQQIGVYLDYNNDGIFSPGEELFYGNGINTAAVSFTFTTPASLSGQIVRLRVIADLATGYQNSAVFNGQSATLAYGQAEDYAVLLETDHSLPLTLLEFSGERTSNGVALHWKTSNEVNTHSFEVQRANAGSSYQGLATIEAAGVSSGEIKYAFIDDAASSGEAFYRLKMLDKDGSFKYSKIISVRVPEEGVQVSGNPFSETLMLRLPAASEPIRIRLIDIAGRVVFQKTYPAAGRGLSTTELQLKNLNKGVYFLEATINNKKHVQKVVKK